MSWDKKIILSLILFVAFMVALGVAMVVKTSESVEDDYYEKDIRFQDNIQAKGNAQKLQIVPKITFEKQNNMLKLDLKGNKVKGEMIGRIYFQKPNNQKIDFSIPLGIDENAIQNIPTERLKKGIWYVWIEGKGNNQLFKTEITKVEL
ncbi:MAG: hypothetical protein EAZ06_07300 [Cytophagales bacterium]|nr:MAG: hypothetical protein EAZ06_07300 [Cytophagales bacterium]